MENIFFAESWEEYFQRFGITTFDDFYHHCGASTVGRNTRRNVEKFTLGEAASQNFFFIKKFHNPQLKDKISAVYNFGWPASQARVEWDNAWYLLNNGIGTYKPVCIGERSGMGIESDSFVVTEELESVSLVEFVLENWHLLERSRHEKIIVAAELVREVHELNVSFPDLYLWHVFINPDRPYEKKQLSIIDLHRMRQKGLSPRRRIKELGRLYWSMSSEYFDQEHKELLITAYIDGNSSFDRRDSMRIIRRCSVTLDKRRTLSNYYRDSKV